MYDSDVDSNMEDLPPLIELNPSSMVAESSPASDRSRCKTGSTQMHESSSAKNEKPKNDSNNTEATNHVLNEHRALISFSSPKPKPLGLEVRSTNCWDMQIVTKMVDEKKRKRDEE